MAFILMIGDRYSVQTLNWTKALNQDPALELHSRTVPSVEAHHHVNGPDTGSNSKGRQIKKEKKKVPQIEKG